MEARRQLRMRNRFPAQPPIRPQQSAPAIINPEISSSSSSSASSVASLDDEEQDVLPDDDDDFDDDVDVDDDEEVVMSSSPDQERAGVLEAFFAPAALHRSRRTSGSTS